VRITPAASQRKILFKSTKKVIPVVVIKKNILAIQTPCDDMMNRTGDIESSVSRHAAMMTTRQINVNQAIKLTPSLKPDSRSLAQYRLPSTLACLIDEPIDGLSNELALFLPRGLGDSSQFVTLALCQVYLRSYHVAPPILYTLILYIILIPCQSQRHNQRRDTSLHLN
jgi:hypothetical protein